MKKFKITFNAPVILVFVALCCIATLLNKMTLGWANRILFTTYHSSLVSPMTYVRFFTHVVGHSGLEHLVGNMCYILLLGPLLEEKYSSKIICIVIIVTALVTSLFHYVFFPSLALCGASGVVFAFIILSSFTGFKSGEIPLTFILVAVFFIGQQIIQAFAINDNISQLSHILGGIVGGLMGYFLNRKK